MRRRATVLWLAAIVAGYLGLFARSYGFGFVWSDDDLIRNSPVFDLPLSRALRTTEHARADPSLLELSGIVLTHEGYRPLLILDHLVDRRLFGRAGVPMHLHNLIVGALGILVAYWLALLLLGRAEPALVVTAIFAWHPFHVEPICFLTARADALSGLFALLAAALVVASAPVHDAPPSPRVRNLTGLGAGVAMFLSAAAKEANLLLPAALVVLALATRRLRAWLPAIAAVVAGDAAYALLRAVAVPQAPAATHASRITQAIVAMPSVILEYARSFLLPFDMSISRPVYLSTPAGWAIALGLVALSLVALWRARGDWRPAVALAVAAAAFGAFAIAPASVAVFSEGAVADRYAYVAVFAWGLALVALGGRVAQLSPAARRAVAGAAALFLAVCLFVSAREAPAWASSQSLYLHAVEVEPDNAGAHNRLGRWLAEQHAWPEAIAELERAAALPRGDVDRVLNNLGVAYLNAGRADDAERTLRRAILVSGEASYHAWYNLGTVERLKGDLAAACASYRRALAISPKYQHAAADVSRYCGP